MTQACAINGVLDCLIKCGYFRMYPNICNPLVADTIKQLVDTEQVKVIPNEDPEDLSITYIPV